jgi:hypothetical protein
MVYLPGLPHDQALALARISGVAQRYSIGNRRNASRDDALTALGAVWRETRTPAKVRAFLLGIELGNARVDPLGINGPLIDLLVAADADEATAAEHEAYQRERAARRGGGPKT